MNAQAARGSDILHGSPGALAEPGSVFQPLIQGSLRRASELATALEARGYQNDGKRTMMHETRLRVLTISSCWVVGMIGSLLL